MNQAKPFGISKVAVWDAYKRVRANKGAAGVDDLSIQELEVHLKKNLYKLWNRMSSGSYLPPPVRRVEIPKRDGSKRPLGIPTVLDRVAQAVVKEILEKEVNHHFHPDSYGYRPKKSASEALGVARQRCWRYDWVLDLDIRGFFDNLDHDLLMKAVRHHTQEKWIRLYIERWLKAPIQLQDGSLLCCDKGTPQGGVISPLLANLFLHYAFDEWMKRNYPHIPFERYADDILAHCRTEEEAKKLMAAIEGRLRECKLELNQQKTKIVYCQDDRRQGRYPNRRFDYLGYTFCVRGVKTKTGQLFWGFNPAVSDEVLTTMRRTMRKWQLHRRTEESLEELSEWINPMTRGWINYYGEYYKSALNPALRHLNLILIRWATRKYKRFKHRQRQAEEWLLRMMERDPRLFAHWQAGFV